MNSPRAEARVDSPTEEANPRTTEIDLVPTEQVLRLLNAEDASVTAAVERVLPRLAQVVDEAHRRVVAGGRVHYFGAGTSGRLATLDAAEIPPTFGLEGVIVAHHAGGQRALVHAVEDAEDDARAACDDTDALQPGDVVIGLTASGRTPYVGGALSAARRVGAFSCLVTSNPRAELAGLADVLLAVETGPEAITGSTRLKAGTAQKLILNNFSTALMVRLGRTYANFMVDVRATNAKLRGRLTQLLAQASGSDEESCRLALQAAGDLKTALVTLLAWPGKAPTPDAVARARTALVASDGRVRDALAALARDDGKRPRR